MNPKLVIAKKLHDKMGIHTIVGKSKNNNGLHICYFCRGVVIYILNDDLN